jgi:hypothetical protein
VNHPHDVAASISNDDEQMSNLLTRTASESIAMPAAASWSMIPLLPLPAITIAADSSCSTVASRSFKLASTKLEAPA